MDKVIIIAEAGVNHNGDLQLAKQLVDVAAVAGADYVKFQTFKAENLVSKHAKKADYQKNNMPTDGDSQYDMLKALELSEKNHHILKAYAESKNIRFLSTGFDESSVDFLSQLPVDLFKIPSGEITNLPYLKHVAGKGRPIILSTGMATLNEIKDAIAVIEQAGVSRNQLTVLHCNTDYPTAMKDVNLLAMKNIENEIGVNVGYSDHTLGIEVSIAAVALGAKVIEKHFTIDRNLPGPDHKASLEPDELKQMVTSIRNIEMAISGTGLKEPSKSEEGNRQVVRKSIHIAKTIVAGETIQSHHLIMMRPATGISPMELSSVIGKIAVRDLAEGEMLLKTDLR